MHTAPPEFITLAAATRAKGLVDQNSFLVSTAGHILSYQVWRGAKFLRAFNEAQIATHHAARRLKRLFEEIIELHVEKYGFGQLSGIEEQSENG